MGITAAAVLDTFDVVFRLHIITLETTPAVLEQNRICSQHTGTVQSPTKIKGMYRGYKVS